MAGNQIGGRKAAATNKRLYGDDFYTRLAAKSLGRRKTIGGFRARPELASAAGKKGAAQRIANFQAKRATISG